MPPSTIGLLIEITILFLILLNLLALFITIKRKHWINKEWTQYKIKQGDNLEKLSKKYDVSYKLLIKANKLKLPYTLTKGQTIKVPPLKKKAKK